MGQKLIIILQRNPDLAATGVKSGNFTTSRVFDPHLPLDGGEGTIAHEFAGVERTKKMTRAVLFTKTLKSQKNERRTFTQG